MAIRTWATDRVVVTLSVVSGAAVTIGAKAAMAARRGSGAMSPQWRAGYHVLQPSHYIV
ncbi:hypothetical protein GCM10010492_44490 [Saccharothrix mutabilis subsp. mutabilis]|uniref:Uncharacterized protein n=1 Tax=Saccharothrix mutabilis subsp. mutabilis TaxID=66855 RepID=A0ABN0U6L3_9PSEU